MRNTRCIKLALSFLLSAHLALGAMLLSQPSAGNRPFVNPSSLPGNFLWFNANDGVTTSGGKVTAWADKSGNGYDLAAFSGNQIIVDATGINGNPGIKFNGADNLYRAGIGGVTRSVWGFWALVAPTSYTSGNVLWWMPGNSWVGQSGNIFLENSASNSQALDYWLTGTGAKAVCDASTFPNSVVQEISGTYDGTTGKIYVNNVLKGSQAMTSAGNGNSVAIGGIEPGYTGSQWSGEIAEMAFYSKALSSGDLLNLHTYAQNTWWNIWSGMTGSITFNGTDNYLGAGAGTGNWEYTQPLTFTCWELTPNAYSTFSSLITHQRNTLDDRGFDILLFYSGGTKYVDFGWFSDFGTSGLEFVSPNNSIHNDGIHWDHIAVTLDGTGTVAGSHIYVNGVDQVLTTKYNNLVTTVQDAALQLKIGDAHGTSFAKGQIAQCAVFTAALSGSDVRTLYNFGVAKNYTGFHDLAHYWYLGSGTDTASLVPDRVGSYDMTMNGTATSITTQIPLPLLPQ